MNSQILKPTAAAGGLSVKDPSLTWIVHGPKNQLSPRVHSAVM